MVPSLVVDPNLDRKATHRLTFKRIGETPGLTGSSATALYALEGLICRTL